jgi:DNA-binding response OmpR family regulator
MRLLLVARRPLARKVRPALEAEGIGAVEATAVSRADAEARSGSYDAILLDSSLLGDKGRGRLLRWRVNGLACDALVLLPPRSTSTERAEWLDAGADGCLLGPLSMVELLAHLRALRRRSGPPRTPAIRLHDLEIDTAARTVRRAGRAIELSPREFDLLVLLARRPGRVVSRAAIRAHLYGGQDAERSNVVDVYIGYLRDKLDRGSNNPLIQTRWGQGYLLRAEG